MIDLHTHSTESDGSDTPEELMQKALDAGLTTVALTDHDTVSGLRRAAEFAKSGQQREIRFIPGVELEIEFPGGEFHLLGLNLREIDSIYSRLEHIRVEREKRNLRMIEKFNRAGIDLTFEEVQSVAGGELVVRPHFAIALVNRGLVSSIAEAFDKYIGHGKEFYVKRETPDFRTGMELVRAAGGIAVLAHPVTLNLEFADLMSFIEKLKQEGLEGVEAFHPLLSPELRDSLISCCRRFELLITGGSDYHGNNRPERGLGLSVSQEIVPPWVEEEFWDYTECR